MHGSSSVDRLLEKEKDAYGRATNPKKPPPDRIFGKRTGQSVGGKRNDQILVLFIRSPIYRANMKHFSLLQPSLAPLLSGCPHMMDHYYILNRRDRINYRFSHG